MRVPPLVLRIAPSVVAAAAMIASGAMSGCRGRASDAAPPPSGRGVAPLASPPPAIARDESPLGAPAWQDPMLPHRSEARPAMVRVEPQPLTETVTVPGAPLLLPAPRDYAAELRANAGDVFGCVPQADIGSLPERVEVELDAVVTGSGVVSRADARSTALSPEARSCLRARIDAARFAAPVPDAPRRVTAQLVYDRRVAAPR